MPKDLDPVWHLFVIRSRRREQLMKALSAAGVSALIHSPIPPHLQGAYANAGYAQGAFPISERLHAEVLSLPMGPHLDNDQVRLVINAVKDAQRA